MAQRPHNISCCTANQQALKKMFVYFPASKFCPNFSPVRHVSLKYFFIFSVKITKIASKELDLPIFSRPDQSGNIDNFLEVKRKGLGF